MALTYTTLVGDKSTEGSIKYWVMRTDVPSATVLTEAEAWIYQRLRVREMMSRDTAFTFAQDANSEALPSDFLDPIEYRPWSWGEELPFVHEASLNETRDTAGALISGSPSRWTIFNSTAYVDVKCDEAFGGVLNYYGLPTALSGSNETNFLTSRYPTLLRQACLVYAYEAVTNEDLRTKSLALAMKELEDANATNEMWRRSMLNPC